MAEVWNYSRIYMTDKEIQFRLKRMGGEINEDNVNALAELNNCRPEEMWHRLGEDVPPRTLPPPFDNALVMLLYKQRCTDVVIADKTGYTETRIRSWRVRNDLPAITRIR